MRFLWNKLQGVQKAAAVCVAVALLFLGLGYLGEGETRAFLKTARHAPGRVAGHAVDIERPDDNKSSSKVSYSFRPRVTFSAADGSEHTVEGRLKSTHAEPPVGTPLEVLYDPANPQNARINTKDELHYSSLGMNYAAILALVVALALIAIDRLDAYFQKRKKKELSGEAARRAYYGEPD